MPDYNAMIPRKGAKGEPGTSVLVGDAAPGGEDGNDGDVWVRVDETGTHFYGPKASGVWPGPVSLRGPQGIAGPTGPLSGVPYIWDPATTDSDKGAGRIWADNADLSAATKLFVSKTSTTGDPMEAWLLALAASDSTVKGTLALTSRSDLAPAILKVLGVTDATGYVKIDITGHAGAAAFGDGEQISVLEARSGDRGTGASGPVSTTPGNLVVWLDALGKDLGDAGVTFLQALIAHSQVVFFENTNRVVAPTEHGTLFVGSVDDGNTRNLRLPDPGDVPDGFTVWLKRGGTSSDRLQIATNGFAYSIDNDDRLALFRDGDVVGVRKTGSGYQSFHRAIKPVEDEFLASGTWTRPYGCRYCVIEGEGAGGGSSATVAAAAETHLGGSGGAGGYVRKRVDAPPATLTVTIGAAGAAGDVISGPETPTAGGDGGDMTVTGTGVSITAGGGRGGDPDSAGTTGGRVAQGGNGGTASGGDENIPGERGLPSLCTSSTAQAYGGRGGSGRRGRGGVANESGSTDGQNAVASPSLAGGAAAPWSRDEATRPGAAGGDGWARITAYFD